MAVLDLSIVPPFQIGNGINGEDFKLVLKGHFASSYSRRLILQNTELMIKSSMHYQDFFEEFTIVFVQLISNDQTEFFKLDIHKDMTLHVY